LQKNTPIFFVAYGSGCHGYSRSSSLPEASFQSAIGGGEGDLARRRLGETRPEKLKYEARRAESGHGVRFLGRGSEPLPQ